MRIAFDVRPALTKNSRRRGIGRYTTELARALAARSDPSHVLVLYGCGDERLEVDGDACEYRSLFHLPKPSRLAWLPDRWTLPRRLKKDRVDLFHSNDVTSIVFRKGTRTVATVHDLIPLVFWREMSRSMPFDYAFALRRGFRRAARCDLIITDSLCSKADICARLGAPEARVKVVYPGCDPGLRRRDRDEARHRIKETYRIDGPFLFYVGGSDFRKNLPVLVGAFAAIRRSGYPGALVMAGETFCWDVEEIRALRAHIARLGLEEQVLFPGYVDNERLPDFYSACDMFIFPSLYEGFGLPVAEALACGAAALVSRSSSIPEVAGEAAEYFDPRAPESLVQAFERLYGDSRRQGELREAGPRQARKFSWDEAARQLLAHYDALLETGKAKR
jgi:glycosyltransferase involved in cell wall biosynthesis